MQAELPQVTQPLLLLHSRRTMWCTRPTRRWCSSGSSSTDVTERVLERSYHVATLDHDAERIFEESFDFISRLAPAGEPAGRDEVARGGA